MSRWISGTNGTRQNPDKSVLLVRCRALLFNLQNGKCKIWPGDEIGRRKGLKILCSKGHVGSIPTPATNKIFIQ